MAAPEIVAGRRLYRAMELCNPRKHEALALPLDHYLAYRAANQTPMGFDRSDSEVENRIYGKNHDGYLAKIQSK